MKALLHVLVLVSLTMACACGSPKKPPTPFDTNWSFCGFPPSARADINRGLVKLKITVNEEGAPVWIVPVASSDPVFEAHAIQCVLRETFEPALDELGNPVSEQVVMTFHFVR